MHLNAYTSLGDVMAWKHGSEVYYIFVENCILFHFSDKYVIMRDKLENFAGFCWLGWQVAGKLGWQQSFLIYPSS
jgi:hypothetical protein